MCAFRLLVDVCFPHVLVMLPSSSSCESIPPAECGELQLRDANNACYAPMYSNFDYPLLLGAFPTIQRQVDDRRGIPGDTPLVHRHGDSDVAGCREGGITLQRKRPPLPG